MTLDDLKKYGADVEDGLRRCMDNEDFYLKMIGMALEGENLQKLDSLESKLGKKDMDGAFEVAHALKGVFGNLALTPIYEPLSELTEKLRDKSDADYGDLMDRVKKEMERLKSL